MTHTYTSTYATTTNTSLLIGRLGCCTLLLCSSQTRHIKHVRPLCSVSRPRVSLTSHTARDLSGWVMGVRTKGAEHLTRAVWATRPTMLGWIAMYGQAESVTVFSVGVEQ